MHLYVLNLQAFGERQRISIIVCFPWLTRTSISQITQPSVVLLAASRSAKLAVTDCTGRASIRLLCAKRWNSITHKAEGRQMRFLFASRKQQLCAFLHFEFICTRLVLSPSRAECTIGRPAALRGSLNTQDLFDELEGCLHGPLDARSFNHSSAGEAIYCQATRRDFRMNFVKALWAWCYLRSAIRTLCSK
jgi:hypothetical protein